MDGDFRIVCWAHKDALLNQRVCRLEPHTAVVDSKYLLHFLPRELDRIHATTSFATVKHLSVKTLAEVTIPLPPLAEQKRIADILDKADGIRRKRREANDQADRILRSAFAEWFGDPVTNSKCLPTAKLGVAAILDRGRSRHRPRDADFLYGGRYPFVQTGDIANARGYINSFTQTYSEEGLAQSKLWPNGTLCITIAANIAKTAILTFDACFPDSVVGLLPGPALTTEYVRYWFVAMEKAIDASATQVAQKNINLELLRSLDIQLPSMSLQKRFSDLAGRVQQFKSKHHSLSLTQSELFNSLIHQAFQGQL
jgi:type I restriction enzyme S subunit